jgi:hypothetical protein
MTNFDIIASGAIAAGLYTEDQIQQIINTTGDLPLHTFAEWKRLGYAVKKGAKAILSCDIWRWNAKTETIPMKDGEDRECDASHYYKKRAYFFGQDQVEKISEGKAARV